MSRIRTLIAAALALSLAGCVSLFPKTEPAQLYRFEARIPATSGAVGKPFTVLKAPTSFAKAAAGDGILTMSGGEAAYIGAARWVSPASVLFDEAAMRAFQDAGGPARLIGRGEIGRSDVYLKLDVRTFEARYDQGAKAAPIVVIEINAALTRNDQTLLGATTVTASVRAGDNRVGPIVEAYNQATSQALGQLVGWVNSAGVK